jgi:hypothetical protein
MKFFTTNVQTPEELESYLIFFEPRGRLEKLIRTARDIYENRTDLKQIPRSDFSVGYLARIIRDALRTGERFRFGECVKVLRAVIVAGDFQQFSSATVSDLFEIYRTKILSVSEPVQWCLSRIVRGQVLDESAVDWLLENCEQSEHIVNRLLGYPERHPKVVKWAAEMYAKGKLKDRMSQLLALLIQDSIPPDAGQVDPTTLMWAIFRARTADKPRSGCSNSTQ